MIDGIFRLSQSDFHEPVNIGNPREMTIKQFAEEIIRITGTKSGIEYKPLPVDDPKVRQPDITRAKKILGWEPSANGWRARTSAESGERWEPPLCGESGRTCPGAKMTSR